MIQEQVTLQAYTTFGIGGPAKFFVPVKTIEKLIEVIEFRREHGLAVFILGGGSNLLIEDQGFPGIVIKADFDYLNVRDSRDFVSCSPTRRSRHSRDFVSCSPILKNRDCLVEIGAGRLMPQTVSELCQLGLKALEWAGGLPGTFGGAVRGNAGCFGGEIKDMISSVQAINLMTGELKTFSLIDCTFAYRDSFFKQQPEWFIVSAVIKTQPQDRLELQAIMHEKVIFRRERHPMEWPNAGSIFKNIPLSEASENLQAHARELNRIKLDPFPVIPTAWVIDQCGLKGRSIGGAQISEKHANFIVNKHRASSQDVRDLMSLMSETVSEKFGAKIEPEIQIVPSKI